MMSLFFAWLTVSSLIAHLWVTNPETFPSLPRSFWTWTDSYYRSANAEEISDLEFVVAFSISAISVLIACSAGYAFFRTLHSKRAQK